GRSAGYSLEVAPRYGSFDSAVTFSCSGLPRGCKATFSPATVTPGAVSGSTDLTVTTTSRSGAMGAATTRADGFIPPALGMALILALFAALAAPAFFRRTSAGKPRLRRLATAVTILLIIWLAGCGAGGNGGSENQGTPAGTYQLLVQAYSGSLTVMTYLTLVIQ
ncbi:MAG: hypothetical protein ACM32H_03265, partial [Candidatus Aminicenantes bacterium RBG_16_66_30]